MILRFLLLVGVVACSRDDKDAARHFCQNTRATFLEIMEARFEPIEQTVVPPSCGHIRSGAEFARGAYMGFRAAAAPFRFRPEVQRVYTVLDGESARHNMLDELGSLVCLDDSELTPDRMANLRKTVASLRARGAAAVEACNKSDD